MRAGVPRERLTGERRVSATPDSVRTLVGLGMAVEVQAGAGAAAGFSDDAYTAAGARVTDELDLLGLDLYLHVRPVPPETAARLRPGTITVGLAAPGAALESTAALAAAGVTAFALELVPRISRAQSMDALTSQALVAGYRCVLEAAVRLPRFFPLYMTAAGTISPARVLVLGAGVAGLQAIGTAKRLGARVSAYDVRAASADEVRSMGAVFVDLGLDAVDGAGGYARELAEDRAALQQRLLSPYVAEADVLITTAAIPGRPAPRLVSTEMLTGMRAGSVVVDLAAESGGNVEGSLPGVEKSVPVEDGAITLLGMADAASAMPTDASRLYAANVANLVGLLVRDGALAPDFGDDVVAGACLVRDGTVLHPPTVAALAARAAEEGR